MITAMPYATHADLLYARGDDGKTLSTKRIGLPIACCFSWCVALKFFKLLKLRISGFDVNCYDTENKIQLLNF